MSYSSHYDAARRLGQVGQASGIQLVQLTSLDENNIYQARPIEFDQDGETIFASDDSISVINLAEPADSEGQIPVGTDAVALDVEGKWIIFVRPTASAFFPGRIVSSSGGAVYSVQEQSLSGGSFSDKQGISAISAKNLAELTFGSGGAVDTDEIVQVMAVSNGGSPPTLSYIFDHPVYAKYLD